MNEHFDKIAAKLPGFELRTSQVRMFEDVLAAYTEEKTFLIEAGTGTGKSLAYLIPAILWAIVHKERTVIATHTIALQEQLLQKDIPFLLDAYGVDLKAALVKGMSNYVCLRKLYENQQEVPVCLFTWSKTATEGSKTELPVLPSAGLWEQIGAESENCTHGKCPFYKDCFFFKARKNALDAHLIIANHHLFFADLNIRETIGNFDEDTVLPAYKRLILDEAHHCEEVATHYFADKVSKRSLIHFLARLFSDRGTGKLPFLYRKICEAYPQSNPLFEWLTLILPMEKRQVAEACLHVFEVISEFFDKEKQDDKLRIRQLHLTSVFWLEQIQPTVGALVVEGMRFLQSVRAIQGKLSELQNPALDHKCEGALAEILGICNRLEGIFDALHAFVFSPIDDNKVRWIEGMAPDLNLITADLDVGLKLSKSIFERLPTVVLCSATLSTNGGFSFIRSRLGIQEAEERIYTSSFNYQEKTQLLVPIDLPDPLQPSFIQCAAEKIWEFIEITQGGSFVLFTSYSMLRECENLLSKRLHQKKYFLYCQGDESRYKLLHKFRTQQRAVLFGTDSFWEGVDVAGDALRCVILVKLPFKVPSDPLFQARTEAITKQGGSAFFDYSLPMAIVKFKQGFGRLIRNKDDRGCVICLDQRLVKKGYGKKFIQSLPDCPHVFEPSAICVEKLKNFYYTGNMEKRC